MSVEWMNAWMSSSEHCPPPASSYHFWLVVSLLPKPGRKIFLMLDHTPPRMVSWGCPLEEETGSGLKRGAPPPGSPSPGSSQGTHCPGQWILSQGAVIAQELPAPKSWPLATCHVTFGHPSGPSSLSLKPAPQQSALTALTPRTR